MKKAIFTLGGNGRIRPLPPATLTEARQELFEVRAGILALINRYRGR